MNKFLQKLFSSKNSSRTPSLEIDCAGNPITQELRLAIAALLIEACSANGEIPAAQVATLRQSLALQFHLEEALLCQTIDRAALARKNGQTMDHLAHSLCEAYTKEQRTLILALAYKVTLSDGIFDKFEKRILMALQFRLQLDEENAEEARMIAEQG